MKHQDLTLIVKVAEAHSKGMKQEAIAETMEISQSRVSGLIKEAFKRDYLRIEFRPPLIDKWDQELRTLFPRLRKVSVVQSFRDYEQQKTLWGQIAADHFDESIEAGRKNIAIAGGSSIRAMVESVSEKPRDVCLYPVSLIGRGPLLDHKYVTTANNLGTLRRKCGAPVVAHNATILPYEPGKSLRAANECKAAYLRNSVVADVFRGMTEQVDVVFVSISQIFASEEAKSHGTPDRHHVIELLRSFQEFMQNERPAPEQTIIKMLEHDYGVVGDIGYQFYDAKGDATEFQPFIGIPIERIKSMAADKDKDVVLIAGQGKEKALLAALRGELVSTLITGKETAEKLVQLARH